MATYQDILTQAAAKGISAADVAKKAQSLGISVPSNVSNNLSWNTGADVAAAQKAAGMKVTTQAKPIDYDQMNWNLTNKQKIGTANPSVTVNQKGEVVDKAPISENAATLQGAYAGNRPESVSSFVNVSEGLRPGDFEDYEDFEWRQKVSDLNKSLAASFNNLSFNNSAFKQNVEKNMQSAMLKNQQLQEELNNYKSKVDSDFELVRNKFDDNTKEQLDRIDKLEKTYMNNLNNMKSMQSDYFNTQQEALNTRVGGEQAGLQGTLSAKGIDQSVINDAITKARAKHLDQYNSVQKQNMDVLNQLNEAYSQFAQQINTQRGVLEDADLALVKEKFNLHKTMSDTGTGYNNALINSTFKPYEDAIAEMTGTQTKEMGYQAQDQAIADRFATSTPDARMQLLQNKLANITQDASGKSKLTDIDIAMLRKASSLPSYPEALQYLINAGNAVASSNTKYSSNGGSVLSDAAKNGTLKETLSETSQTDSSQNIDKTSGQTVSGMLSYDELNPSQGYKFSNSLDSLYNNYDNNTTLTHDILNPSKGYTVTTQQPSALDILFSRYNK